MPQISWNVSHGTLPQHPLKGDEIRGSEVRMHPGGEEKQFFEKKKKKTSNESNQANHGDLNLAIF